MKIIRVFIWVSLLISASNLQAQKPNIVLFLIDDMGWMDVGFNGQKYYETPNIDKLAQDGMIFTNAYANASNCAPTRACLMSGKYSPRHGVYTVNNSDRGKSTDRRLIPHPNNTILDGSFFTLAEAMKGAGYITGHFGKWHLGDGAETSPEGQGFDVNIAGDHRGAPPTYFSPYKLPKLADGPDGEYLTDRLTDEAITFIENNQANNFFLYFPHYAVHTPIQAKSDMTAKYEDILPDDLDPRSPKYAAMVESVDQSVGRIIDKLNELNLSDNTIVIFFADNGGHGKYTNIEPLRGYKGTYYEGGMREPMAIKWPAQITAGTTCNEPIISTDFYPTLAEIVGATLPADYQLDGESLLPLMEQTGNLNREAIYWHAPHYLQEYISENGKFRCTPSSVIRKGKWKLIEYYETGNIELFNLDKDISEKYDSAEFLPEKVNELLADLHNWQTEVDAPVTFESNTGFVQLIQYDNLLDDGAELKANNDEFYSTKIGGKSLSSDIKEVSLKVYHNAKEYYINTQTIDYNTGEGKFSFDLELEGSDKPYKIKMCFLRFKTDEVDVIRNHIIINSEERVEINKKVHWLKTGEETTIETTLHPIYKEPVSTVSWKSLNETVASVSSEGKVLGKAKGRTFIVAKYTSSSDTCLVDVFNQDPEEAEIMMPDKLSFYKGNQARIKPIFIPPYAAKADALWSSDNDEVASVANGLVQANSVGATTINAYWDLWGITKYTDIDVLTNEYALMFEGADDANCGKFDQMEDLNTLTIEAWVYLKGSGYLKVFHYGSNPDRVFLQENNGKIHMRVGNGGNEISVLTDNKVLSQNEWVHIAAVFDGSLSNAECVKLYKNGIEQGSTASGQNPGKTPITNLEAFIGSLNGTSGYFIGAIDELKIWSKALNKNQLTAMMNQPIQENNGAVIGANDDVEINGLNWSDLLGYYNMEPDVDESIATDYSNYKSNGAINKAYYVRRNDLGSIPSSITEIILPDYLMINKGSTATISPVILPEELTAPSLTWVSSNASIATVDNGTINGIKKGETYIVAYSPDSYASAYVPVTVNDLTAIKQLEANKQFQIFPNPAEDEFFISFENDISKKEINIYNGLGKLVYAKSTNEQLIHINSSNLESGIYHVLIKTIESENIKKLIVK